MLPCLRSIGKRILQQLCRTMQACDVQQFKVVLAVLDRTHDQPELMAVAVLQPSCLQTKFQRPVHQFSCILYQLHHEQLETS